MPVSDDGRGFVVSLATLTLTRAEHSLGHIHKLVPLHALIISARFTQLNMIVLYRP